MGVHGNSEFLREIIPHPKVMVAREKKYGNPSVTKLGELRQKWKLPFWNYLLVFKPEVKDIAYQKNRCSLIRDVV